MNTRAATSLSPEELHQKLLDHTSGKPAFEYRVFHSDAHFTYVDPETGRTLLHALAIGGNQDDIQRLKAQDTLDPERQVFPLLNVDALDNDGYTALMRCLLRASKVQSDDFGARVPVEIFELLLELGADYAPTLPTGETMMGHALKEFRRTRNFVSAKIITLLIAHDHDFDDADLPAILTATLLVPNKATLKVLAESLDGHSAGTKAYLGGDLFFENLILLSIEQISNRMFLDNRTFSDYGDGSPCFAFEAAHVLGIDLLGTNAEGRRLYEIATEFGLMGPILNPWDAKIARSFQQVLRDQMQERIPPI